MHKVASNALSRLNAIQSRGRRPAGTERPAFALDLLSGKTPLPLHRQVRQRISNAISQGELVAGDLLPPEEDLAIQGGVSRSTVRHALAALVHDGFIERKRGAGTRVVEPKLSQPLSELTGFAEDMLSAGLEPLAKVVSVREIAAHGTVAEQLRLKDGSKIMRIERVRLGDGRPILFDVSHLPAHVGRRVVVEDLVHRPIFDLFENEIGITLGEAEYRIQAVSAGSKVARHLEIPVGGALLLIERTTYADDGIPIDYETLHYRGDRMAYFIRLRRRAPRASLSRITSTEKVAGNPASSQDGPPE